MSVASTDGEGGARGRGGRPWGDGFERRLPAVVAVAGVACALVLLATDPGRFTMTPFREAQTAITAQWMVREGHGLVGAELPVFGQPWRAPFEFPLFQWVVARVASLTGGDLAVLGKLLSGVMLVACGLLVRRGLGVAGASAWAGAAAGAFVVAAPLYVGFGWAFLIETTVLAVGLAAFLALVRWLEGRSWVALAGGIAASALAGMMKPTTWLPVAVVAGILTAVRLWQAWRAQRPVAEVVLVAVGAGAWAVAGAAAALAWTQFGDGVKALNPLAWLTSSESLSAWNYGSLAQKVSPLVWASIVGKNLILLLGPAGLVAPVVVAAVFVVRGVGVAVRVLVAVLVAGYLVAPAVFTNLHFRHAYYAAANGVFLVAAVVVAVDALGRAGWLRLARWGVVVLAASAVMTAVGYTLFMRALVMPVDDRQVAALRALPVDGPYAALGMSWSSNVPYRAGRKAMISSGDTERWRQAVEVNRGAGMVALVWSGEREDASARWSAAELGLGRGAVAEIWPGVWMQVREGLPAPRGWVAVEDAAVRHLKAAAERVDPAAPDRGLVAFVAGPSETGAGLLGWEVGLRRGSELFYFRVAEWRLVRLPVFFGGMGAGMGGDHGLRGWGQGCFF